MRKLLVRAVAIAVMITAVATGAGLALAENLLETYFLEMKEAVEISSEDLTAMKTLLATWREEMRAASQDQTITVIEEEIIEIEEVAVDQSLLPTHLRKYQQCHVEHMACLLYREVGSMWIPEIDVFRCGDVVLNRVDDERFPNSIYEVITAPGQYQGLWQHGIVWPEKAKNPGEQEAVRRAHRIAYEILIEGKHSDIYQKGYVWMANFPQGKNIIKSSGLYFGR